MTLEDMILGRSALPKNGKHTITEHLLSNKMNISGESVEMLVYSVSDAIHTNSIADDIIYDSITDNLIINDTTDNIEIKENYEQYN